MLSKRLYIPIGILIIALVAIAFFALRSDTPTEPIMIYKVVEPAEESETQTASATRDIAEGGHFHADGTFHAEPHDTSTTRFETNPVEYEAKAEKIRELEAKLKRLEAEKAERLAIEAESEELLTWSKEFQDRFFADVDEVLFAADLSESEFLEKYPTVEDRINIALELLKFEDYREEVVKRFEGASPKVRQLIYQELENIGYLDEYKRIFLQPSPIPEYVAEFIQANLDEEAKTGGISQ
jgi:hypothetical protein